MEHRRMPGDGLGPRRRPPSKVLATAAVVALALGLGACSSDDGGDGEAADTTTTTAATSSSTTAATVEATPTTRRPSPASLPLRIEPSSDGVSPDGDGCEPGDAGALPDGLWFGTITVDGDGLEIDLACFFTGDAADAAAAEDDASAEVPVANGYYVRLGDGTTYPVPVTDDTLTIALDQGGASTQFLPQAPGVEAAAEAVEASSVPFRGWVLIVDGVATVIQQQYLP